MSTYLLVDATNLFFRCRHGVVSESATQRASLAIHVIFNSIRKVWRMFDGDHVVMALDGRSWRRDHYAPYKASRRLREHEKSEVEREEDAAFFAAMHDFSKFIRERTNCTVLKSDCLEADDCIARWIDRHSDDQHVVVSSDSDFQQLLNQNVCLYDGIKHHTIRLDGVFDDTGEPVIDAKTKEPKTVPSPEYLLFEKCIRGDSSDNIFSAYPRVRKTTIQNAFEDRHRRGYFWNNLMLQSWFDHNGREHLVRDDYERNRMLIDLRAQPAEVVEQCDAVIDSAIGDQPAKSKLGFHFLKFCSKWQLQAILDTIGRNDREYVDFLGAPYPR